MRAMCMCGLLSLCVLIYLFLCLVVPCVCTFNSVCVLLCVSVFVVSGEVAINVMLMCMSVFLWVFLCVCVCVSVCVPVCFCVFDSSPLHSSCTVRPLRLSLCTVGDLKAM